MSSLQYSLAYWQKSGRHTCNKGTPRSYPGCHACDQVDKIQRKIQKDFESRLTDLENMAE